MRLKIVTPTAVCLDTPVRRLVAEGPDGHFGMLPRHIDFASELVPGILVYETEDGTERYSGHHSGTLVKCGAEVLVATRTAVLADDMPTVRRRISDELRELEETEREARSALARLEADIVRRFQELEQSS